MKKVKTIGYKLIFRTFKSLDEIEEVLDNALNEIQSEDMNFILQMSTIEIDKSIEELKKDLKN